jgi:hypothetical protein
MNQEEIDLARKSSRHISVFEWCHHSSTQALKKAGLAYASGVDIEIPPNDEGATGSFHQVDDMP